jgi:hypothetical protein
MITSVILGRSWLCQEHESTVEAYSGTQMLVDELLGWECLGLFAYGQLVSLAGEDDWFR